MDEVTVKRAMLAGLMVVTLAATSFSGPAGLSLTTLASPFYTAHNPISINGNANFTAANGVTGGSGTASDPYVIEGWEIQALGLEAIVIRNTDAHFAVRRSLLYGVGGSPSGAPYGVRLANVSNGWISNVTVFDIAQLITIENAQNVSLTKSNVTGFRDYLPASGSIGVWISYSSDIFVLGNSVADTLIGINIVHSANLIVMDNEISAASQGTALFTSTNVSLARNLYESGGIRIGGDSVDHFGSHTISPDNLVNGLPIRYYKDRENLVIDGIPTGQLLVVNSTNVRIANLTITRATVGIFVGFVEGAAVSDNHLSQNGIGIQLSFTKNATLHTNFISSSTFVGIEAWISRYAVITSNTVTDNSGGIELRLTNWSLVVRNRVSMNPGSGIAILDANNNTIANNDIANNGQGVDVYTSQHVTIATNNISSNRGEASGSGILLGWSSRVTVRDNNLSDNVYGVHSLFSSNSTVFHNNFLNNSVQALETAGENNTWDDGYPNGGNYWSDFGGVDSCGGPLQDACIGPDGIGDSPYHVGSTNRDRYPLMAPYTKAGSIPTIPNPLTFFAVVGALGAIGAIVATVVLVMRRRKTKAKQPGPGTELETEKPLP